MVETFVRNVIIEINNVIMKIKWREGAFNWKIWKKSKSRCEMRWKIWKIQKKIVKRYEKYGRNPS